MLLERIKFHITIIFRIDVIIRKVYKLLRLYIGHGRVLSLCLFLLVPDFRLVIYEFWLMLMLMLNIDFSET